MSKPLATIEDEDTVFDVKFHPSDLILGTGTIEGNLSCFRLNKDLSTTHLFTSQHHTDSLRSLCYSEDGNHIFTASKDLSFQMVDVATGKSILRKKEAHDEPLNVVKVLSEHLIATGDDGGSVKIWDARSRKLARKYHENTDYISDMMYVDTKTTMLITSGDGCLSVYDPRTSKPLGVSANQDDELLSLQVVRNETKVVVGTQEGVLLLFSFGMWGDCTDRFPGHPMSVSSLVKMDDSSLLTGSSDGMVRAVHILPNKLIGICADNGELSIESMSKSFDGKYLATCDHESVVKIWSTDISNADTAVFEQEEDLKRELSDEDEEPRKKGFFADLD
ncbi:WD40-repeat-containing domain protein [Gorgonomyces haynaldii]|nr:WD40-repeat-containing domain protein [Gorgonomyces haynaldii]